MGQSHIPLKLGVMSRIILYSFLSLTLVALPTYCADGGRVTWYYPCQNCSTDYKEQEGCLAANRNNDVIVKDGSSPAKFCQKHGPRQGPTHTRRGLLVLKPCPCA